MRKVFIICYFALAAIILTSFFESCKRNSIDDSTVLKSSYTNDPNFASLSTAIIVAQNVNRSTIVLKSEDKANEKAAAYLGTRKIKDNLTILDKDKQNPYFYVFNYEAGGFAIISADKRQIPFVGFCDQGYFNKDSIPLGLNNWFETSASYIQHLRISNAKQSKYVSNQWFSLQGSQNQLKNAPVDPPLPDDYISTVTVGPLLTTNWGQDNNSYCPALSGGPNGHALTGCSTTAIAQVMAFWKYPANYNWSAMAANSSDAIAVLMGDIFPCVIDKYNTGASSCMNDFHVTHTFLNRFNYSSASLAGNVNGLIYNGGYKYQTVENNLDARQPVILGAFTSNVNILNLTAFPTGTGHMWVCDGYRETIFSIETYLSFHMNWGWNGSYNGWYAFNDWSTANGSYNYCADMIYNIHP